MDLFRRGDDFWAIWYWLRKSSFFLFYQEHLLRTRRILTVGTRTTFLNAHFVLSFCFVRYIFARESWFTRLGALAPALVRFGEVLGDIQNYEEALLQSLETTFCAPMEDFVKREVKTIRKVTHRFLSYVAGTPCHTPIAHRGGNTKGLGGACLCLCRAVCVAC